MKVESLLSFTCPVKMNSGNKVLEGLPFELAGLNAAKPLILASPNDTPPKAIKILLSAFGNSKMTFGLFDGIDEAEDLGTIEYLKNICQKDRYDALIALGGRAADAAKVLNMTVSYKLPDARLLTAETTINKPLGPLVVAITAGATGLETSSLAHFGNRVYRSEYLAPSLAVIDPRLAVSQDAAAMACSGLAAFARAVEAHGAVPENPFRRAYSFAAIRFIRENLPAAVSNPGNRKAALAVANAAAMSGCALADGGNTGLHKIGQAFSGTGRGPAGMIMAMALPYMLNDYKVNGGFDLAALLHPLADDDTFAKTPESERADAATDIANRFVSGLQKTAGKALPRTLKETGLPGYLLEDLLETLDAGPDGARLCSVARRMWDGVSPDAKKG